MAAHTPRQRLASLLMGRDVLDFIDEQRTVGRSWPEIADAIRDATNGEVDVSRQAIQQWRSSDFAYEQSA